MSVEVDLEAPYARLTGEILANRYQIEARLGEGAMGAVYKAKHVKVGRAFAVKVLHPRLLEDKKVLQRFEREAELAGRLRHPNVIGVVDVGETSTGMRYMVMDFAEGPDLATLLSDAPFPPQRVLHLTRQMLEGLFHAHEQGLIHRDFKPENVIVERDSHGQEVPRIVDFGIAILREGGEGSSAPGRLTTNGLVLGTPHYMAPEQAVADPIDHRIDLFALGIIVYEMLCGKLPFDGSGAEVARANLLLDPPPISQRVPYLEVDPLLEAFARRLMAKKRDLRPATAKIARDLLDLIEKDREAAAAALGVPSEAARAPMTTQDVQPMRGSHNDTFPPPIRSALETPPQAPAMRHPKAVKSDEHKISTQPSEAFVVKRRAPMIAAALVGLGIVGGAAFVMLSNKDDDKAKAEDTVAVAEPGSAAPIEGPGSAAVVEAPKVDDTAGSAQPDETKVDETKTGETKVDDGAAQTTATTAAQTKAAQTKAAQTGAKKTTTATKTTKGGATTTKGGAAKVATNPVETKPVETKPVETKPAGPVDAGTLARQYQSVGTAIKALEQAKGTDVTSDLWARYRMIRISDAMSTQDKRDAAATILAKLTGDIATRKK